jgi:hypothetical protein
MGSKQPRGALMKRHIGLPHAVLLQRPAPSLENPARKARGGRRRRAPPTFSPLWEKVSPKATDEGSQECDARSKGVSSVDLTP